MTIEEYVLRIVQLLRVTNYGQIFTLAVPRYTRSRKVVYRAVKHLEQMGKLKIERKGRESIIRTRDYRRRQVDHDLGVNDVRVSLLRSCWELGYPVEQYFLPLNGWKPDGVLGFYKDDWRLVGIEYQRSPLTKRRWMNKFSRISNSIEAVDARVYIFFVVELGVSYTEHYVSILAKLAAHKDFYFASKETIDKMPAGELLTAPVWYHADENGKAPIFYKE